MYVPNWLFEHLLAKPWSGVIPNYYSYVPITMDQSLTFEPEWWNVWNEYFYFSFSFDFYVEGISLAQESQLTFAYSQNGESEEDTITIHVVQTDLDVDSDNDNQLSLPDRSADEEDLENKWRLTGKIVEVNSDDSDHDGVPDFFDGYDWDGNRDLEEGEIRQATEADNSVAANPGAGFVPIVLQLPDSIDLSVARLYIDYAASDPLAISATPDGDPNSFEWGDWSTYNGGLRLWTKDETAPRDPRPMQSHLENPSHPYNGDFVNPSRAWLNDYHLASDFDSFDPQARTIILYAEAVQAGNFAVSVWVVPDPSVLWYGYPYGSEFIYYDQFYDTVRLTAVSQVSLAATDQIAMEGGDEAAITISRGEADRYGSLPVYYKITTEAGPGAATDAVMNPSNPDFTIDESSDWRFYNYGSLAQDPYTKIGWAVIPHGTSSTRILIDPNDDPLVEWNETITVELLSSEEFVQKVDLPTIDNSFVAKLPTNPQLYDEQNEPYWLWDYWYNNRRTTDYQTVPGLTIGTFTILDNDALTTRVDRRVDLESTGEHEAAVSNGTVDVSLHDGTLRLSAPVIAGASTYRSNDNLQPIATVDFQLPFDEENVPTAISGRFTVGPGIYGQSYSFAVTGLDGYLEPNPARDVELTLLGPIDLASSFPTGHYDFDVKLDITVDGHVQSRTARNV